MAGQTENGVHQHGDNHEIPTHLVVHKSGAWLPADHRIHKAWLGKQVEDAAKHQKPLRPVLKEFQDLIESDARLYMLFTAMFDEVPYKHVYRKDPTGHKQIRNYQQMLEVLNHVFGSAPVWTDAAEKVGMVGVPMCAILDYPMSTPSGHAAFLDPAVNKMLKKVLNEWGKFLLEPASAGVLHTDRTGWLGDHGQSDMMSVANAPLDTNHKFDQFFHCDTTQKHYGYKSWDDFFTRRFKDEVRPIASPDDDNVIANCCESRTFAVQNDVKLRDKYWIKGQPYSIRDMLANDPVSEQFAGGTVYQAFLSALSYHRWHSPVSGTIKKAYVVDGTYFSEPLFEGLGDPNTKEIDAHGISSGQGYLSHLATRAIIIMEADNPAIGMLAFIGIGMDEVSTCEITAKEGQHVKKGEETGMFHFGGSTHCLIFRPGVKLEGFPKPGVEHNVPVRSQLAVVRS